MKLKYTFIILLTFVLLFSLSQLISIPPFAGDIFEIYKSGYFSELDRGFDIIKDTFIEIKMLSKPVYAWIFLEDIRRKHNIEIKVFNNKGMEVSAPGDNKEFEDNKVIRILNSLEPSIYSEVIGDRYYSAVPVLIEDRCRFCHVTMNNTDIIGVFTFERDYDSHIYYSSERIIIFSVISFFLLFMLYLVIRWDPGRLIKELFDKKE